MAALWPTLALPRTWSPAIPTRPPTCLCSTGRPTPLSSSRWPATALSRTAAVSEAGPDLGRRPLCSLHQRCHELVPGDTNNAFDIFVFDRQTNTTQRVSVASDGTEAKALQLRALDIGGWALCDLYQRCLEPCPRRHQQRHDIFLFDRQTNTTKRVSVASDGTEGNGFSFACDFGGWPIRGL